MYGLIPQAFLRFAESTKYKPKSSTATLHLDSATLSSATLDSATLDSATLDSLEEQHDGAIAPNERKHDLTVALEERNESATASGPANDDDRSDFQPISEATDNDVPEAELNEEVKKNESMEECAADVMRCGETGEASPPMCGADETTSREHPRCAIEELSQPDADEALSENNVVAPLVKVVEIEDGGTSPTNDSSKAGTDNDEQMFIEAVEVREAPASTVELMVPVKGEQRMHWLAIVLLPWSRALLLRPQRHMSLRQVLLGSLVFVSMLLWPETMSILRPALSMNFFSLFHPRGAHR